MCARHCFEYFTYINSFNPQNNPMGMMAASYPQILQEAKIGEGKRENDTANREDITEG